MSGGMRIIKSSGMRIYGNEHWEFNDNGLMHIRDMSANDYTIQESERRYL